MIYLGIDNGASGGIAALTETGAVYRVDPMPPTDPEIFAILEIFNQTKVAVGNPMDPGEECRAVLEHAQAFPKMGVTGAFNYGRGYGAMQMGLHAASIPFDIVVPRKWQAALGCLSGGDKNVTKRRAAQLFPLITVTHAIADALLLAEYCRRLHERSYVEKVKTEEQAKGEERQPLQGEAGYTFGVDFAQGKDRTVRARR